MKENSVYRFIRGSCTGLQGAKAFIPEFFENVIKTPTMIAHKELFKCSPSDKSSKILDKLIAEVSIK